ncbi:MAG: two-component system response regulator [Thermoleophilia bacterium]|nr:two-component system response regulator [Thermoleophilia bacterium]
MSAAECFTCVVVDDHEAVRAGTIARIAHVPWLRVVGEAATASDARHLLRDRAPDLALMDVRLPDGNGAQLARELADEGVPTKVVLYSGAATTYQAEQALDLGVAGFVLKDSTLGAVVDALHAACNGRRYIDPTIAADLIGPAGGRRLSPREHQIVARMADGGQNPTIAFELKISVETVKAHVSNILAKLEANGRTQAVATALREGIIG